MFTNEDFSIVPRLNTSSYSTISHITTHTSGVENLNPHKATGPDAISAHLLHQLSADVAPALTFVLQMSFDTGQIPDYWCMAYIVSVYKRVDKCSAEKYRPVSITPICSKVKEHISFSNIKTKTILIDFQHGFHKKHSCKTQLITTIEDMTCNLSNGTQIDAVFLDFAKAFDKMSHQRLLLKLEYYGIRSNTLQWMGNFLNSRKRCVIVECVSSNVVPVTSGVPQGTVLGPLLFLIFINDLTESITPSVKLFAGDCLVYRTINSSNDAIQLQEDRVQLGLWVNSWQMTINPHKCSIMDI